MDGRIKSRGGPCLEYRVESPCQFFGIYDLQKERNNYTLEVFHSGFPATNRVDANLKCGQFRVHQIPMENLG